MKHTFDRIEKNIDDLMWFQRIGDVAFVDKVYIYGPPLWKEENPNAQGADNPVKFWTYIIIPKNVDPDLPKKALEYKHPFDNISIQIGIKYILASFSEKE